MQVCHHGDIRIILASSVYHYYLPTLNVAHNGMSYMSGIFLYISGLYYHSQQILCCLPKICDITKLLSLKCCYTMFDNVQIKIFLTVVIIISIYINSVHIMTSWLFVAYSRTVPKHRQPKCAAENIVWVANIVGQREDMEAGTMTLHGQSKQHRLTKWLVTVKQQFLTSGFEYIFIIRHENDTF